MICDTNKMLRGKVAHGHELANVRRPLWRARRLWNSMTDNSENRSTMPTGGMERFWKHVADLEKGTGYMVGKSGVVGCSA